MQQDVAVSVDGKVVPVWSELDGIGENRRVGGD